MKKLIALLALLATPCFAQHYVGDYAPGATVCRFFSTYQPSTGAAFALASGAVDVYQEGSDTQDTDDSGVTLSASVDSVAGMNRICVDTSSDGTFYAAGRMISVVLTAGTVDSVSVVGTPILSFSLNKTAALRPSTAGRTLGVESDGDLTKVNTLDGHTPQTGDVFARVGAPAGASVSADIAAIAALLANHRMGISAIGTAQAGSTSTTLVLASATNFVADDHPQGHQCFIYGGTGIGQSRIIESYVNSTDTATMSLAWETTPDNTSTYVCFGSAPASGSGGGGDATEANQDLILADTASLLARLTATRAGYLDNLSAGAVATAAALATVDSEVGVIDGIVDAILVDTGTDLPALAAALDALLDEVLTRLPDANPGETGGVPVIDANGNVAGDIKRVNGIEVDGAGTEGDPFGPAE